MRGLCVGEDMAILFFTELVQNGRDQNKHMGCMLYHITYMVYNILYNLCRSFLFVKLMIYYV